VRIQFKSGIIDFKTPARLQKEKLGRQGTSEETVHSVRRSFLRSTQKSTRRDSRELHLSHLELRSILRNYLAPFLINLTVSEHFDKLLRFKCFRDTMDCLGAYKTCLSKILVMR
jgi:hypothetical protein